MPTDEEDVHPLVLHIWTHCAWERGVKTAVHDVEGMWNIFLTFLSFSRWLSWWIVLSKTSKILWFLLPPKSALRKSGFLSNSSCEDKELSLKCVCMKIGFTSWGYAADGFWKQQQFEPSEFYAQLRFSAGKLTRMSNKCWHSQHVTTQIGCFHCQQFYVGAAPFHRHHH